MEVLLKYNDVCKEEDEANLEVKNDSEKIEKCEDPKVDQAEYNNLSLDLNKDTTMIQQDKGESTMKINMDDERGEDVGEDIS